MTEKFDRSPNIEVDPTILKEAAVEDLLTLAKKAEEGGMRIDRSKGGGEDVQNIDSVRKSIETVREKVNKFLEKKVRDTEEEKKIREMIDILLNLYLPHAINYNSPEAIALRENLVAALKAEFEEKLD